MTQQTISQATLDFFTAESLQIHAVCDRALVPRVAEDGSVFSMAQRVCVMEGVLQGMVGLLGQGPMTTEH